MTDTYKVIENFFCVEICRQKSSTGAKVWLQILCKQSRGGGGGYGNDGGAAGGAGVAAVGEDGRTGEPSSVRTATGGAEGRSDGRGYLWCLAGSGNGEANQGVGDRGEHR